MSDALVWHLLMTVLVLVTAFASLSLVWSIHALVVGTGAFQARIVYPTWLVTFLFAGVFISSDTAFFDVVWFYGIPWPYSVAFIFLLIWPLNTFGVAGTAGVVTIAAELIKLFWVYG